MVDILGQYPLAFASVRRAAPFDTSHEQCYPRRFGIVQECLCPR